MFFGYYLSAATMTARGERPARARAGPPDDPVAPAHLDPARALVPVLTAMPAAGIALGDILADSGYAHRDAEAWAIPLRARRRPAGPGPAPARPRPPRHPPRRDHRQRQPLLPADTPSRCWNSARCHPAPPPEQTAAHDQQTAELARHKLGRHTADDADGYHRVTCPAAAGKIRCPLRPDSMTLGPRPARDPHPARAPAACCTQQTITVPPRDRGQDPAKTRLPISRAPALLRRGAPAPNATFSTIKDPATTNIARGWCRLTGLTPLTLWIACLLAVRNQRILTAFDARQADNARRAAAGLPPKTRNRRRTTLAALAAAPP